MGKSLVRQSDGWGFFHSTVIDAKCKVDIVGALTDSANPTDYLKKLRRRDAELGFYIGTNCPQVEMITNGKKRRTLEKIFYHRLKKISNCQPKRRERVFNLTIELSASIKK